MMKPLLRLRMTVARLPAGAAFTLQRGCVELLAPMAITSGIPVFEFTAQVADTRPSTGAMLR